MSLLYLHVHQVEHKYVLHKFGSNGASRIFSFQDEKRDVFYLRLHEHATTTLISRQSSFARNVVDDVAGEVSSSRTSSFGSATGFRMAAPIADFSRGSGIAKNYGSRTTTACDYIGKKGGQCRVLFIKCPI